MTREEALIKAIDVLDEATAYENAVCYVTGDDKEWLEFAIKALAQEPRTGHWIKMPLIDVGQTYSHECSVCGRRILATNVGLSEFPYCHCGAKMVEQQTESEDDEWWRWKARWKNE